jgi:hypothetical protein
MKLTEPLTLAVFVKETGSNNTARIPGQGISASSTCAPLTAIEAALGKLIRRNGYGPVRFTVTRVTGSLGHSQWQATLTPEVQP